MKKVLAYGEFDFLQEKFKIVYLLCKKEIPATKIKMDLNRR